MTGFYPAFNRILVLIQLTSVFCFFVITFSIINFIATKDLIIENEYKNNKKILKQISYNINILYKNVTNMGYSILLRNEIRSVIYSQNESSIPFLVNKIDYLRSLIASYNYFHSITLYNGTIDRTYSTYNGLYNDENGIHDLLTNSQKNPFKLLVRTFGQKKDVNAKDKIILSIPIFDEINSKGLPDGAVILNLNADWLYENISAINSVENNKFDELYIMTKDGYVFCNENSDSKDKNEIINRLKTDFNQDEGLSDTDIATKNIKIGSNDYIVLYTDITDAGFKVFKVFKYQDYINSLRNLLNSILIISIVFFIVAIIVSFLVSSNFYKPVKELVNDIEKDSNDIEKDSNDIEIINDDFKLLRELFGSYRDKINQYQKKCCLMITFYQIII